MTISWVIIGILPAKLLKRPTYSNLRWKRFTPISPWKTTISLVTFFHFVPSWKIIDLIKGMRRRTYFYLNRRDDLQNQRETYNLISQDPPPNNRYQEPFEMHILNWIKKIKFKIKSNQFHPKIFKEMKKKPLKH